MGNIVYTDAVYTSLRNKGFDGTTTDMLYQELLGRGYSSDLNTMMFQYLGDVGYTGDIASRLSQVGGIEGYAGCRSVATFNGVSQYVSIPTVTLSGDFEVEFVAHIRPNRFMFAGDSNNTWATITSAGAANIKIGSQVLTDSTIPLVDDGELHTFTLKRVGTDAEFAIDSVVYASKSNITGTAIISVLCTHTGLSQYFLGHFRDIKIWDGGDRNTGTLVRDYPLDDGYANNPVVRDLASNQDGTAINFTEATWSERCDL